MQALDWGARIHREELHSEELGIAGLTALMVNINRDPKKGEPVSREDFFNFKPQKEEEKISPQAADAFFSLSMDSTMPFWVPSLAPVEKLRACRAHGAFPYPRVWMNDDVFLVLPTLTGDRVKFAFGVIRGGGGTITVEDPDSGNRYCIELPKGEPRWFINESFDRGKLILSA